ncbi:MAG: hypothetical protein P8N02_19875 [Actinomycetota bacterium]|nr:hypothetical protein [Actinomycetota bacterium]
MSTGTILAIAIPALVVLALLVAVVSLRRRDDEGLGHLARETKARDTGATGTSAASTEAKDL